LASAIPSQAHLPAPNASDIRAENDASIGGNIDAANGFRGERALSPVKPSSHFEGAWYAR
jgi:hypothetical protein